MKKKTICVVKHFTSTLGPMAWACKPKHVVMRQSFSVYQFIPYLQVYVSYAQAKALTDNNIKLDVLKRYLILISSEAVRGLHTHFSYLIAETNKQTNK